MDHPGLTAPGGDIHKWGVIRNRLARFLFKESLTLETILVYDGGIDSII